MIFDPIYIRARIRLHGVPPQHWNRGDIATLISGFGYLIRMAPYISNENYRYLRIFVACKAKILHRLNLTVDPYEARSFVELEGWMPSREGSFPPPPCDGRDDIGGNRSDRTRHQDRSNLSSPNEGSSLPVRGSRKIVTTTENNNTRASRPRRDNNRAARPRGMEVYRWVAKTPKETPPVHNITGNQKLTKGKVKGTFSKLMKTA